MTEQLEEYLSNKYEQKIKIKNNHLKASKLMKILEKELNKLFIGQSEVVSKILIAFAVGQPFLLIGDINSGKSTLLKFISQILGAEIHHEIFSENTQEQYNQKILEAYNDIIELQYTANCNLSMQYQLIDILQKTSSFVCLTCRLEVLVSLEDFFLDNFAIAIYIPDLSYNDEKTILKEIIREENYKLSWSDIKKIKFLIRASDIVTLNKIVSEIEVSESALEYAIFLVNSLRANENIQNKLSLSSIKDLISIARAYSLFDGSCVVNEVHVKSVAKNVLLHRLHPSINLEVQNKSIEEEFDEVLANI